MTWVIDNWENIMTVLNTIGLIFVHTKTKPAA